MKNPMTTEEQCQAVIDNAAGHDMELRPIGSTAGSWSPRIYSVGEPLNFRDNEYRRKPALIERFVNIYDNGRTVTHNTLNDAIEATGHLTTLTRRVRLIVDSAWVDLWHVKEEKNPWRPIIKSEWPECWPGDKLNVKYPDGTVVSKDAEDIRWGCTTAIEWRYAED